MNTTEHNYSQRDRRFHLHSFTDLSQHEQHGSVVIERGTGIYLIDSQ